jgi:hypothetical protein
MTRQQTERIASAENQNGERNVAASAVIPSRNKWVAPSDRNAPPMAHNIPLIMSEA